MSRQKRNPKTDNCLKNNTAYSLKTSVAAELPLVGLNSFLLEERIKTGPRQLLRCFQLTDNLFSKMLDGLPKSSSLLNYAHYQIRSDRTVFGNVHASKRGRFEPMAAEGLGLQLHHGGGMSRLQLLVRGLFDADTIACSNSIKEFRRML